MFSNKDSKFVYAIGSRQLYKYDGDFHDWEYLAMRWLPCLQEHDYVLLPDHWVFREFLPFLTSTLLGFEPNVVWLPVKYLLDESVMCAGSKTWKTLKRLADSGYKFVPYDGSTTDFRAWFNKLKGAQLFGEDVEWGKKYSTKEWLHPWVNEPCEPSLAQKLNMPVLPGFNASSVKELLRAWVLLDRQAVVIKPHTSSFGDGLVFLRGTQDDIETAIKNYSFKHGPVALELFVKIDTDEYGELSWSTHYAGTNIFGPVTRQLVVDSTSSGNITPGFVGETSERLALITKAAIEAIKPNGYGGFNGPFVNGVPYFTDPNCRITGVCSSLLFRQLYCPQAVTLNKKLGKPNMPVEKAWEILQSAGLAFCKENQRGVYIQAWIPSAWSQIICAGSSQQEAINMYKEAKRLIG